MDDIEQVTGKKSTMDIFDQIAEIKTEEAVKKERRRVRAQEKENTVRILLAETNFSAKKIAGLVGVSITVVNRLKTKLKEN